MSAAALRMPPAATMVLSQIRGVRPALSKKGFDVAAMTWADPTALGSREMKALSTSEVIIGEPATVAPLLDKCPNLKWFQSTFAGCNQLLQHERRDYVATRLSGVLGPDMSEYVAMHILTRERHYNDERMRQLKSEWRGGLDGEFRRLSDLTLGVLGLGDIGSEIARVMHVGFRMRVLGCRSRPSVPTELAEIIESVYGVDELHMFLSECDYVVSVLPSTPATRGLLGGNALKVMQAKQGVLINVGRGDVIPEEDAVTALNEGWVSHLVADVFEVEPLPKTSLLWSHPKVTVSPHVSAVTNPSDVAAAFSLNAELYSHGGVAALQHGFNFRNGY